MVLRCRLQLLQLFLFFVQAVSFRPGNTCRFSQQQRLPTRRSGQAVALKSSPINPSALHPVPRYSFSLLSSVDDESEVEASSAPATKTETLDWWKARLPNYFTYLRLILIPALVFSFYRLTHYWTAACFALATLSDLLDGYLARRWKVESEFGAFLDPVADKLMVCTCLALLSGRCGVSVALPTSLIVAREISVSALREFMASRQLRDTVKVSWAGKLKTALTMISLTGMLLTAPSQQQSWLWKISLNLLYVSTILTMTSGSAYFQAAAPYLLDDKK